MKNLYKKNRMLQMAGFCALIEEGSFALASKKLNTAESNIRLQVSSLEKFLGFKLVSKTKKKPTLTPEGERVYRASSYLLFNFENLYSSTISKIQTTFGDTVRIASHPFILSHILPQYLKEFKKILPTAHFVMFNLEGDTTVDLVLNGLVDFMIIPTKNITPFKDLKMFEFYKCRFALGMHKLHPLAKTPSEEISWNMISKYDFVHLGSKITTQGFFDIVKKNNLVSNYELNNGTWEICLGLIKNGLTISGTDICYFKDVKDVVCKPCPQLFPHYQFDLVFNQANNLTYAGKTFLDFFQTFKL